MKIKSPQPTPPASNSIRLPSHPNFAGIWTWSRGGGWKGPYLKNEFWCELNAYVISQWTQNPTETEHDIFNRFARDRLHFQPVDVDRFRQICLLSAQGVLRGHMSMHVPMPHWWTRDEWIGGLDQLQDTINTIIDNNRVEPVLAEKLEAAAIFARTEALARQLDIKDPALKDFIITSCTYGRIKYDIFAQGWTVMLLGQLGDRTGNYAKDHLVQAINRYDQLWNQWRELEKTSSSCPTLYMDYYPRYEKGIGMFPTNIGMGSSVDKYRHLVGDK